MFHIFSEPFLFPCMHFNIDRHNYKISTTVTLLLFEGGINSHVVSFPTMMHNIFDVKFLFPILDLHLPPDPDKLFLYH